jgi:hypothetical protein
VEITDADQQQASFVVPENMGTGENRPYYLRSN